jgi:hypothetical protein
MEEADLLAWVGKPPERPSNDEPRTQREDDASDKSNREPSPQATDTSSSAEEVNFDGTFVKKSVPALNMRDIEHSDEEERDKEEEGSLIEVVPDFQNRFYIDVPKLEEEEKHDFEHLPGHYTAQKIVSNFRGDRYLVKLMSGEKQLVSSICLSCFCLHFSMKYSVHNLRICSQSTWIFCGFAETCANTRGYH